MSSYLDIHSLRENPTIGEKRCRAIRFIARSLAYGLILGIVSRVAWDYGIIKYLALVAGDVGTVIWIIMRDSATACWDFIRFVFR
jgi:hypothetical protein